MAWPKHTILHFTSRNRLANRTRKTFIGTTSLFLLDCTELSAFPLLRLRSFQILYTKCGLVLIIRSQGCDKPSPTQLVSVFFSYKSVSIHPHETMSTSLVAFQINGYGCLKVPRFPTFFWVMVARNTYSPSWCAIVLSWER